MEGRNLKKAVLYGKSIFDVSLEVIWFLYHNFLDLL